MARADLLASDSDEDVQPAAQRRRLDPPAQQGSANQDAGGKAAAGGSELKTGMAVELVGFASAAMNGAKGTLGKFSEAKGIWQVFLEGTATAKAVKPKNLKPSSSQTKPAMAPPAAGTAQKPVVELKGNTETGTKIGEFNAMPKPRFVNFKTDWRPDDNMPQENDANGWLEVLRDVYVRQLREINQYPEPPAFHTIFEPVADPTAPDTKALRQALTMQLQILTRARYGEGQQQSSSWGKGKGSGPHIGGKPAYPWQQSKGNWRPSGMSSYGAPKGGKPLVPPPITGKGAGGAPDLLNQAAQVVATAAKADSSA